MPGKTAVAEETDECNGSNESFDKGDVENDMNLANGIEIDSGKACTLNFDAMTTLDRELAITEILRPKQDGNDSNLDESIFDKSVESLHLTPPQVKEQWASYLETVLKKCNWLAAWKPDNLKSKDAIFVDVADVDFEHLTAQVVILQEHWSDESDEGGDRMIESNEEEEEVETKVNLTELHPIIDEDFKNDGVKASLALEHCRFFYKFIWRPWDDDSDTEDWVSDHLAKRFELFRDFKQRSKKSRNWTRFEALSRQYQELQEERNALAGNEESDIAGDILEIEDREHAIRRQAMVLEDPELRMSVLRKEQVQRRKNRLPGRAMNIVMESGSFENSLEFLRNIENILEEEDKECLKNAQFFANASKAIDASIRDDVIVVPGGNAHLIDDLGEIELSGAIYGIGTEGANIVTQISYDDEELKNVRLYNVSLLF